MQIKRQTKLSFYCWMQLINFIFLPEKRRSYDEIFRLSHHLRAQKSTMNSTAAAHRSLSCMETASPLPSFTHFCARFCPIFRVILMGQPGTWAFPAVCPHSAPRVLYRGYGRRRYRHANHLHLSSVHLLGSAMVPISGWRSHANTRSG